MTQALQPGARRYTYADLAEFPDDHYRREIIDGELVVTASPITRHQRAAGRVFFPAPGLVDAGRRGPGR